MLNIIIFSLYLLFIYYIGYKGYKRVNTAEDLIVAGWSMPLSVVTGSLVAALLAAPFFLQQLAQAIRVEALKVQQQWVA